MTAFDTAITEQDGAISGPFRAPKQMLAEQEYDGHTSIHDQATGEKLGFKGATIEGPTHFSQFAPLGYALWGDEWVRRGCISAHYRAPVYEGEEVKAFMRRPGKITALTPIFGCCAPTAMKFCAARPRWVRTSRPRRSMSASQHMGALYPFSLAQKLARITEPSVLYNGSDHVWRRPIVPVEMISVLMQYSARENSFKTRGPAVGLFADQ